MLQQGVVVQKSQFSFQLIVGISDTMGRYNNIDISDYLAQPHPRSDLARARRRRRAGVRLAVRDADLARPVQARFVQPDADDVRDAVRAQNTQVSAGEIGAQPATAGQQLNATVTAQSRLQHARTVPQHHSEELVRRRRRATVEDVARVEIGADSYQVISRLNGRPAAGMTVRLAPGANALTTIDAVKKRATELGASLPEGMELSFPVDNTRFIRISIREVIYTLIEAIVLVILVMCVFLQNWRTTLIPAIAVPVVLLGTFGALAVFGYTINTLTLFALVLSIGLLVDDAIVVIENVERIMREEQLSPRDATRKSMQQITGALIAIALVLSAVFVPMAFFGGSTGVIYRQFSVTIVSAMVLSIFVALVLTPALCATLLKPVPLGHAERRGWFFTKFNRTFESGRERYVRGVGANTRHDAAARWSLYGVIVAVMAVLLIRMPTGFLPRPRIRADSSRRSRCRRRDAIAHARSREAGRSISTSSTKRTTCIPIFIVAGFSFAGQGQNTGQAFVNLTRLGRAARRSQQRTGDRRARVQDVFEASATRRSSRCCRRRCANSATPPASKCSSRIAAISATTR